MSSNEASQVVSTNERFPTTEVQPPPGFSEADYRNRLLSELRQVREYLFARLKSISGDLKDVSNDPNHQKWLEQKATSILSDLEGQIQSLAIRPKARIEPLVLANSTEAPASLRGKVVVENSQEVLERLFPPKSDFEILLKLLNAVEREIDAIRDVTIKLNPFLDHEMDFEKDLVDLGRELDEYQKSKEDKSNRRSLNEILKDQKSKTELLKNTRENIYEKKTARERHRDSLTRYLSAYRTSDGNKLLELIGSKGDVFFSKAVERILPILAEQPILLPNPNYQSKSPVEIEDNKYFPRKYAIAAGTFIFVFGVAAFLLHRHQKPMDVDTPSKKYITDVLNQPFLARYLTSDQKKLLRSAQDATDFARLLDIESKKIDPAALNEAFKSAVVGRSPFNVSVSGRETTISVTQEMTIELQRQFGVDSKVGVRFMPVGARFKAQTNLDGSVVVDTLALCDGGSAQVLVSEILSGTSPVMFGSRPIDFTQSFKERAAKGDVCSILARSSMPKYFKKILFVESKNKIAMLYVDVGHCHLATRYFDIQNEVQAARAAANSSETLVVDFDPQNSSTSRKALEKFAGRIIREKNLIEPCVTGGNETNEKP